MTTVSFDLHTLPNCCGALELGDIDNQWEDNEYEIDLDVTDPVKWLQKEANEKPVFINFVQCRTSTGFEEHYVAQELMDAISGKEFVVDLGTWINSNSGNRIHAFMIKGKEHVL